MEILNAIALYSDIQMHRRYTQINQINEFDGIFVIQIAHVTYSFTMQSGIPEVNHLLPR